MPLPTTTPKLNTGITIDGKIKALADLVATHERRTFASLVEHAIWLYVQKRLPTEEIERVLMLLSNAKPAASSGASNAKSKSKSKPASAPARAALPEAPVPVRRREKLAETPKSNVKPKAGTKTKSKAKARSK